MDGKKRKISTTLHKTSSNNNERKDDQDQQQDCQKCTENVIKKRILDRPDEIVETKYGSHNSKLDSVSKENATTENIKLYATHTAKDFEWKHIRRENLNLDSTRLYRKAEADVIFSRCEEELIYNVGDLAKIQMFGKWIDIPRKQVAHGDAGLTYTFSGNTVPAQPWTPFLLDIRKRITEATGCSFNFVLINRYQNGKDYMGEHKDDEKDLSPGHPIASLSLGQPRDFVFRHQDSRKKMGTKRKLDPVTIQLQHGMLLMMNHPTNSYWYHALPKRANALGVRVNMTFRKMEPSKCKPAKIKIN